MLKREIYANFSVEVWNRLDWDMESLPNPEHPSRSALVNDFSQSTQVVGSNINVNNFQASPPATDHNTRAAIQGNKENKAPLASLSLTQEQEQPADLLTSLFGKAHLSDSEESEEEDFQSLFQASQPLPSRKIQTSSNSVPPVIITEAEQIEISEFNIEEDNLFMPLSFDEFGYRS